LLPGDIIVSFGNANTAGVDELHRLLTANAANKPEIMVVLRGVERKRLRIVPISKEN
jgi:hypothetical protein